MSGVKGGPVENAGEEGLMGNRTKARQAGQHKRARQPQWTSCQIEETLLSMTISISKRFLSEPKVKRL